MRPRPAIEAVSPYQPGKPAARVRQELGLERVVKLASNEGPYGPFPAALEAIAAHAGALNRYPELSLEVMERLAERHGVDPSWIALGNGADAVVGYLSAAYLDPGDEALMGWPSFPSYHLDALKMGATPVHAELRDGAYDTAQLAERVGPRTKLVYVCNPNNPTGGMVGRQALRELVDAVPETALVVVDEAYHDYVTDPDYPDAIAEHVSRRPNVAAVRTFSKIYGLAGLRMGYLVGPPNVVADVARMRNAFDVSELAHAAALASIDSHEELARRRELNERGRRALEGVFADLDLPTYTSVANFVCAEAGDGPALARALELDGVIVRPLAQFGAPGCIRVTVGTPDDIEAFRVAMSRAFERRP
jgi:histidinol-phosphate aminotransferase